MKSKNISRKKVRRVIQAAKNGRDKQLISMLSITGLKSSEISSLKLNDIDFNTGEIRAKGRDGKVRVAKYPRENLGALVDWLNKRERARYNDYVFVSRFGEKLSLMRIHKIVQQASERAGIRGVTPHVLRHTFVSHAGHSKP